MTARHELSQLALSQLSEAVGTWALAPERTSVRFTNKTLWGLVPVNGRFTDVSGSGRVESDGSVSGRLVIGAASLRTGIGKRDQHLRSADFFDTDNFPEITAEVTGASPDGLATTLTIRGTTLPVPLKVQVARPEPGVVAVTGHAQVDRTRWGVSGNMAGMMPTTTALSVAAVFVKSGG